MLVIASICIGFAIYPLVGLLREKFEEKPLELSGPSASFFREYIVQISLVSGDSPGDYNPFYGYDDGDKILISVKSPLISQPSRDDNAYALTKDRLAYAYCNSKPMTLLNQAKLSEKTIQITYYDKTGESLLFGTGVSPDSCNGK